MEAVKYTASIFIFNRRGENHDEREKRWIKKIAALLLIFTLVFSTTGCGSENDSKKIESDMSMADDVQKYVDKVDEEFAYDVAYTLGI